MKKILAFLALASVAQFAVATNYDDTAAAVVTGTVVSNPSPTNGAAAANTCSVLSAAEPAVTVNLSTQVVAAMVCNTGTNAVGAVTAHPGGRPVACGGNRCVYVAATSGGPVTAVTSPVATSGTPTADGIKGCAETWGEFTGGTVPSAC